MRMVAVSGALALLVACGGKKEPVAAAAAEEAPAAEAAVTAEMPDSPEAKAFAKGIVASGIQDLSVSTSGARFVYRTMTFGPDGTWSAKGAVTAGDETMECVESGGWSIEEASSSSVATMVWAVEKTNCAARDPGTSQRVQVTLADGGPTVAFR